MVYMTLDNGLVAYLFKNNIEMSLIWKIMNLRYHVISMVDQSSWPVRVQEITLSFYCKKGSLLFNSRVNWTIISQDFTCIYFLFSHFYSYFCGLIYDNIWVKYVNSISEIKFYPNWTDKWLYKLENIFQVQQNNDLIFE